MKKLPAVFKPASFQIPRASFPSCTCLTSVWAIDLQEETIYTGAHNWKNLSPGFLWDSTQCPEITQNYPEFLNWLFFACWNEAMSERAALRICSFCLRTDVWEGFWQDPLCQTVQLWQLLAWGMAEMQSISDQNIIFIWKLITVSALV